MAEYGEIRFLAMDEASPAFQSLSEPGKRLARFIATYGVILPKPPGEDAKLSRAVKVAAVKA